MTRGAQGLPNFVTTQTSASVALDYVLGSTRQGQYHCISVVPEVTHKAS